MNVTPWLSAHAENVLDAVVDAIVTIDATGIIHSVNRATVHLFGYSAETLLGAPVTTLMPPSEAQRHQGYINAYLATGEHKIIGIGRELVAQRANGEEFPIYLAISEIRASDQVYFAGIIRDLSREKAAQAALAEQRNRLNHVGRLSTMGEMTASIAHEINQPLTSIALYTKASINLLANPEPDLAKVTEALQKLNAQSLRAGAIIERVQRFVRNESASLEIVHINQLLRDIVPLIESDARLHGVQLAYELEGAPVVRADPVQMQQVAINLVRNAIDAMCEIGCSHGDRIVIRTSIGDATVSVHIIDEGPGVAAEQAERIFKAFHTTKEDGMGLGLAICQSIITEHGGVLNFRNRKIHGADFYFTLPLAAEQPE